jgi:hypothetical protein
MTQEIIALSALAALGIVTLCHKDNWGKSLPCFAVFLVTAVSYHFYQTDTYLDLQEKHGQYVLHGLVPLFTIFALAITRLIAPSRLSVCLMSLFALYFGMVLTLFWLSLLQYTVANAFEAIKFVVFAVEIALMLSTKLTDWVWGLHGCIRRSERDGNHKAYGLHGHDWLLHPVIDLRGDKP